MVLGDADKFSSHIMRIFDSDGNGFLDFKEFLMAIDIASCQTEESKLAWVFKLYDVDNDGVIVCDEMASLMETLESLEFTGPQKSKKRKLTVFQITSYFSHLKTEKYCDNNVEWVYFFCKYVAQKNDDEQQTMISAGERARNLFSVLDQDGDGVLTMEEFIEGIYIYKWKHKI